MILRTPGSTRTNPLFPDMTLFRSVVIGRVREGAATIAFTERPDPVDVGAQHVVDTDIPPAVDLHPSGAQAEIVGIGSPANGDRSEEPTSELQSLMRHSYAVSCLKKKQP